MNILLASAHIHSARCTLVLFGALCAAASASADFNAARDFSIEANPNGVWSYGWTQSLGSSFNLSTLRSTDPGLQRWDGSVVHPTFGNYPFVGRNSTNQTTSLSTISIAPGQMILHPGPGGEYSIVRFVAPAAGSYSLSARFAGLDFAGPTTTDVHVLLNSESIFGGLIGAFGSGPSFQTRLPLQAGDRVDFAVGFGTNGGFLFDSTALDAQISAVPETGSWALMAAGLLGLVAWRGRRNGEASSSTRS